jgi:membrane protease YdiL (CAAX protease family)
VTDPPAGVGRYLAAVGITLVAVVSQYFLPQEVPALLPVYSTLVGDLLVVYGIPIAACALLLGFEPLRQWRARMGSATVLGLSWYGAMTLLALAVVILLTVFYDILDPSALKFLTRMNPALTQAEPNPWLYVGLSFLVGACEETIFRGWIFGFWRGRSAGWVGPAIGTSVVFAGVHLYYGFTYGPASPLVYVELFLLGFAFAQAYRLSGGNLVVVALLHGVNDATAYLTLVIGTAGTVLHYLVVAVGALLALALYITRGTLGPRPVGPGAVPPVWPYFTADGPPSPPGPSGSS